MLIFARPFLFHKYKIYRTDDEEKGENVIPMQTLPLEENVGYDGEHAEADAFLNHFELYQVERASVSLETDAVGRNLTAIFKEGYSP